MSVIYAQTSGQGRGIPPVSENELTITSKREIEPLLERAREVLHYYRSAVNCSAALLDRTGSPITINDHRKPTGLCEFCRKYRNHHGPNLEKARLKEAAKYPCASSPLEALEESRRAEETRIYACELGCIYWTSPLFRNGHYAGALVAGHVLPGKRKEAAEKILIFCRDRIAAGKFAALLEEVPERNPTEINAMARLLEVCADRISGKREKPDGIIRRYLLRNEDSANRRPAVTRGKTGGAKSHEDSEMLLDRERTLLAAFRRGDRETGGRILMELIDSVRAVSHDNPESVRFRAIELVVLLSRAAAPGTSRSELMEANNRYLRRIEESGTVEEITKSVKFAAERLAGSIFSFMGIRHSAALRKAERFIWENYTRKISLEEIAKYSGLSAPYFSTTFKEEMGENLTSYLNRLRIEKAAALLSETCKPLKEVANLSGFEDQSWFSKIFKSYTGISPGKYREQGCRMPLRMGRKNSIKEVDFPGANSPPSEGRDILSS